MLSVYNNQLVLMGQSCCRQLPDREFVPKNLSKMEKTLPQTVVGSKPPTLKSSPPPNLSPVLKLSPAAEAVQRQLGEWKPTLPFDRGEAEPAKYLGDETIYVGQWKDGKPHGLGKMYLPNQTTFTGCFKEGAPFLQGRMITGVGVYYEGEILNSQADGVGKLVNKYKKYSYEGSWKDDLPHGQGKQTWEKSEYLGEFKNGIKSGYGEYHRKQKYLYVGGFKDNQFSGQGTITFTDGQIYVGNWERGEYNGFGAYNWADKSIYQGNYVNGIKDGSGRYSRDEKVFKGTWKGGKREGQGRLQKGEHWWLNGSWVKDTFVSDNNVEHQN